MLNSDLLLSVASVCYVVCAIPQLLRNLRFKDTLTQSIMTNIIILFASMVSLIAYIELELFTASIFLVLEVIITGVLIIQILIWRKNRKNRKLKEVVKKTEGARSLLHSIRGLK